jgi:hypothetical protein
LIYISQFEFTWFSKNFACSTSLLGWYWNVCFCSVVSIYGLGIYLIAHQWWISLTFNILSIISCNINEPYRRSDENLHLFDEGLYIWG